MELLTKDTLAECSLGCVYLRGRGGAFHTEKTCHNEALTAKSLQQLRFCASHKGFVLLYGRFRRVLIGMV